MQKRTFTDQMGRLISVPYPPQRIISLVPSQTELLFDLGLDMEIIGITKFCIHPREKFKRSTKIGGTKMLDLRKIRELKPDLIIGNKEENDRTQIEELMKEFPVWMSDIEVLPEAIDMIKQIGELTGRSEEAEVIADDINEQFLKLKKIHKPVRTAYFIWKDPYMLAGKQTFIDDILRRGGFENVISDDRYPEISVDQLKNLKPECIFLSSEPYPFKDEHVKEIQRICPDARVSIVDGEMLSWYGSRLLLSPAYLRSLG
ncbi:ABC transporter substrate-binding protein [Daejeonella sp.]|uniref:ABC transporter substrate-binding protein n=1 Tax=Daejeonella sp. TaxID=2805397 RepID=UPI00272F505B|nr:helical backbone metal receptor [Daejeonella sp.]MDP2413103.1 helical backbone metal receptor [Daejeonella sp.]